MGHGLPLGDHFKVVGACLRSRQRPLEPADALRRPRIDLEPFEALDEAGTGRR